MAEEQFPWLDWPHSSAPPNLNQIACRVEQTSNPHWRSPFYMSSNPTLQTQLNNNNTQSQYYPSYKQQEESYMRLEDVLPYPSYRWGPPPAREHQRQTSYTESSSGLPLASTSLPYESPEHPTNSRQPPSPKQQEGSREPPLASDMYTGHEAKRRRVDLPETSRASSQAVRNVANPALSNTWTQSQDTQPSSQHTHPSSSNTSQTPKPPISQTGTQPAVQRTSQQGQRPGSQYVAPIQTRPTTQIPPRTSSPAISQGPTQRDSQYASQARSKATSRAPSSASPQPTAHRIPRRGSHHASPRGTAQALPQSVATSAAQLTAQQNSRQTSRPSFQYVSPTTTLQAPQTVAPSDTHIRPPQLTPQYISRPQPSPQPSPQTKPQPLPQDVQQPVSQSTTQRTMQQVPRPNSKPGSQPLSARPTPQTPLSLPVPRQATQSATPPVSQPVSQTSQTSQTSHILATPRPPSTQAVPPAPASSRPPQPPPRMTHAPHTQPAHAPQGAFANFTFQPENPADRTHLKRRMDIVSCFKEADAAQKVTYDPRTIARDILIASSRHPTEPALNHHLFRLRDLFSAVDMNSDLQTFRWDLVDPDDPSRDMKARTAAVPKQGALKQTSQTAPPPAVQVALPVNNISPPQPSTQTRQPTFQQPPPSQPKPKSQPQPQPQPKLQPQPQIQLQSQKPPVSSPAPRPHPAPATPSTPNSMEKRRRGRPPGSSNKSKVASAAVVPPAPSSSYPVYACRWGNCQSELHNLELLKKHLFKVHVSYQITCGWKGCAFTGALPAAKLMNHVKKEHLDSLAWKLGDGPAVSTSVDRDSSLKTVPLTIPESNQPGNEDSLIFPADYGSIRAFNRVHGIGSQQDKAREIFKAVQRLKEHIGVGLDRGGCELATPLRNQRVSNDEEIYEVRRGT